MDGRKAITFLKGVAAAMALLCVIALAVHPATAMGLALAGMLFVPVLLWLPGPTASAVLTVSLEQPKPVEALLLVSRFQRPPPYLL